MAIDTIVLNRDVGTDASPLRLIDITLTGDDAYPTGGTATFEATLRGLIAAARPQGGSLSGLKLLAINNNHPGTTYDLRYDAVNDKLVVRALADNTQPANATDLSGSTFRLMTFWG
jgi:hypothetical protein